MTNPAFYSDVSDKVASREFLQYLQQIIDQPLGQMIVTADGIPPPMKKHGTILWQSTLLAKVYIVHYDGSHHYYWESSGSTT